MKFLIGDRVRPSALAYVFYKGTDPLGRDIPRRAMREGVIQSITADGGCRVRDDDTGRILAYKDHCLELTVDPEQQRAAEAEALASITKSFQRTQEDKMNPAIAERVSRGQEAPLPTEKQKAYHAVIHVVVPGIDHSGKPITETGAQDYIAYTLQDQFLDWRYVEDAEGSMQTPIGITVSKPYVEGTFLGSVES